MRNNTMSMDETLNLGSEQFSIGLPESPLIFDSADPYSFIWTANISLMNFLEKTNLLSKPSDVRSVVLYSEETSSNRIYETDEWVSAVQDESILFFRADIAQGEASLTWEKKPEGYRVLGYMSSDPDYKLISELYQDTIKKDLSGEERKPIGDTEEKRNTTKGAEAVDFATKVKKLVHSKGSM